MSTPGERIMEEIRKQSMIQVYTKDSGPLDNIIFVWSPNSAEQLDALISDIRNSPPARPATQPDKKEK